MTDIKTLMKRRTPFHSMDEFETSGTFTTAQQAMMGGMYLHGSLGHISPSFREWLIKKFRDHFEAQVDLRCPHCQ
jgi:hypothetical protein